LSVERQDVELTTKEYRVRFGCREGCEESRDARNWNWKDALYVEY